MGKGKSWTKVTVATLAAPPHGHLHGLQSVLVYLKIASLKPVVEGYYSYYSDKWYTKNGIEVHPIEWRPK